MSPTMGMDLWNYDNGEDAVCEKHHGPHEMDYCPVCVIEGLEKRVSTLAWALRRIVAYREGTGAPCSHACEAGNCRYCQARAALGGGR